MCEYSPTYYQMISLMLINFLHDPDLVRYFINVLRKTEIDDSQIYHIERLPYGPVTTRSLCFREIKKNIKYFRKGFLQKLENGSFSDHIPLSVSESVVCLRFMLNKSWEGELFRRYYGFLFINECYREFQEYIKKDDPHSNIIQPHLLIHISEAWTECRKYGSEIADPNQFFIVSVH